MCFVYVCDVHHVDKRIYNQCSGIYQEIQGQGYPPSPSQGRATVRLPPSKFFIFFLPIPITSSIYPFSLSLRGFLFLCVYFLIHVSFRVSEGKNGFSYPICIYAVIIRSILIFCYFPMLCFSVVFFSCISLLFCSLCYVLVLSFVVDAVFFADLPILLPSVGLSSLLCVIIRLGVFRGSEAEKSVFVLWLGGIYTEKGRTRHLCAPSALCLWLVISCAGMMLCCCVG